MNSTMGKSPTIALNNGVEMPLVGFGVFQIEPKDTTGAVLFAFDAGYRLIDTAAAYHNEREVGQAVAESGLPRSEIFVTTKLWVRDYGYESSLKAFDLCFSKLNLEYVDMVLLHFPIPSDFTNTVGAYKALEKEMKDGRVKAIGVCNFHEKHLEDLIAQTDTVPTVNQVELHPYFSQKKLIQAHQRLGIVTQAWSPLGGVNVYDAATPGKPRFVLEDPIINAIAEKRGKSPAQIVLRWHVQQGISIIPKSAHAERIRQNMDIFNFELISEEMTAIDSLDTGIRAALDPDSITRDTYDIVIEP